MDAKAPIRPTETADLERAVRAHGGAMLAVAHRLPRHRRGRNVHAVTDLMYAGAPYTVIQRAMNIHPTVSELIPTMLGDLKPLDTAMRLFRP